MARQSRMDKYKSLRAAANSKNNEEFFKNYNDEDSSLGVVSNFDENNNSSTLESLDNKGEAFSLPVYRKSVQEDNVISSSLLQDENITANNDEEFDFMQAFSDFGIKKEQLQNKEDYGFNQDDTLIEPLTFDRVNEQVDEELERALNKVRANIGKGDYNTRIDILNKIRNVSNSIETNIDDVQEIKAQFTNQEYNYNESSQSSFNNEINESSYPVDIEYPKPNTDVQQDRKEIDETIQTFFSKFKGENDSKEDLADKDLQHSLLETNSKRKNKTITSNEEDEENQGDKPILIKVLNGVIIVLFFILICIAVFFTKTFLL